MHLAPQHLRIHAQVARHPFGALRLVGAPAVLPQHENADFHPTIVAAASLNPKHATRLWIMGRLCRTRSPLTHNASMNPERFLSLDDFEGAARRYLPRPLFGYIEGAAETNASRADN